MRILLLALLASAPLISASPAKRATTLIPKTVFDSAANLEEYSSNNYPWGDSHNGRARMNKAHAVITSPGVLTITAQHVTGQAPVTSGGKKIPINYLSGAINAKQHITVTKGGGLVFSASFKAPVAKGVYLARLLAHGRFRLAPEIDMAEWKGSGKISFNTFNTSSSVQAHDIGYPSPGNWHDIMDGTEVTTHYGRDYVGKAFYLIVNLQMEGSSGSPGPKADTKSEVRNLVVTTL